MKIFGNKRRNLKINPMGIQSKALTYLLLTVVFIASSGLSFWFVYQYFGKYDIFTALSFIKPDLLLRLFALLAAYFLFDTMRLFYILKTLNISISFFYMIKLTFINIFVSSITPFAMGGGFAQIYFMSKNNIPPGEATAASTIRTLIPIVFLFIAAPIVIANNRNLSQLLPSDNPLAYLVVLAVIYGAVCFYLYRLINNPKKISGFIFKILKFLQTKKIITENKAESLYLSIQKELDNFAAGINLFIKGNRINAFLSLLFSLLYLLSFFLIPALIIGALGYNIPVTLIVQLQVIVTFITYFAPTPGAVGIVEAGFAFFFSEYIRPGDIAALTLSWRFFSNYLGVLIGLAVFYIEIIKTSFRNVSESQEA